MTWFVVTMAITPRVGSPCVEQCSSMTSCPKWDGKPRIVKCPSWCSLHACCRSTSSLVFPWGGDHEYNHVEARADIAAVACGSYGQSMSICESVTSSCQTDVISKTKIGVINYGYTYTDSIVQSQSYYYLEHNVE